jgi:hypothetical protein
MDFDSYVQSKGYAPGQVIPRATASQLHQAWLRDSASFKPTAVTVPHPETQEPMPFVMTGPNTAVPIRDSWELREDADNNLIRVNPNTGLAMAMTNAQGEPVKAAPKTARSSRYDDLAMFLENSRQPRGMPVLDSDLVDSITAPKQDEQPGMIRQMVNRLLPWSAPTAAQPQTNMPVPANVAAPAGSAAMGVPAPAGAQPADAAQASQPTAEQIREAYRAGQLTREQARQMLMGEPAAQTDVFTQQQFQQMTGQSLPAGEYQDANGRPFRIQ